MQLSTVKEKMALKGITAYRISKELDEPMSSIYNFLNGEKVYTDNKAIEIIERINDFLEYDPEESENEVNKFNGDMITCSTEDPELFIKLYALGLDSKAFTPDEKYKLAVAYKKLTDSQTKQK